MTTERSTRGRGGRRTKLTPEVHDRIVTAVRAGNYVSTAAALAGISETTIWRWLQEGQQPGAPRDKREFWEAVTRARAEAEVRMVAAVHRAATGGAVVREVRRRLKDGTEEVERQYAPPDGRVALEYLARSWPDRWGRNRIEVTGADGGPLQVDVGHTVELAGRLAAFRAARPEAGGGVIEGSVVADVAPDTSLDETG